MRRDVRSTTERLRKNLMSGEVIDITVPLRAGMPTWPTSPGYSLETSETEEQGDLVRNSLLTTDVHCGTHIDAPSHFLADGETVDELRLDLFMGEALVIDVPDVQEITPSVLEDLQIPAGTVRLLLKTRNAGWLLSNDDFRADFAALTVSSSEWMVDRDIRLVGIDYLSIELFGGDHETHRKLLRAGTVVVEGLDLSQVGPGVYELICLPMRLQGAEGAPVRAVLR